MRPFALNTASVSVGRSTGNTISLDTDTISRYHFSITQDNQIVAITDLDSANGTYLDGVRLESNKPYPMLGGEEIQIGQLRMIYQSIDDIPTLPITTVADDTQRIEQESAAFRMEVYGPEIAVPPGSHTFVEVSITNLLEEEQERLKVVEHRKITLRFQPFQVFGPPRGCRRRSAPAAGAGAPATAPGRRNRRWSWDRRCRA
ncbi:FHA domain-containing protein [bacterium]|nr:FHA domain-containing protein [bacterium]